MSGVVSGGQGIAFEDLPRVPRHMIRCWHSGARSRGQFTPGASDGRQAALADADLRDNGPDCCRYQWSAG
jgi:hypothetical protein